MVELNEINIVYVDDEPDLSISKYLAKVYSCDDFQIKYDEVTFKAEDRYEYLLNNNLIVGANIIIIDSRLFENEKAVTGKFTGEEFKIILKRMFPFIEVIVVTQNDHGEEYGTISKYKKNNDETADQYYATVLKREIDTAISRIKVYRNIASKLKENQEIDKLLIEKIMSSLDGTSQYDELTKKDIDEIIEIFKEIKRDLDVE